jgi:hypothetical protein
VNLSGRLTNIQVAFAFALAQSDANVNVGVTAWIGGNPSKGVRAVVTAFWKPWRSCPFSCLSRLLRFLLLVPFLFSVVPFLPNQAVPADHESSFVEAALPSLRGSDRRRVVKQPASLLLLGEPGEPGMERVVGWQECLLAMKDGRVRAVRVVIAIELARAKRQLDAAEQGRMRVRLEVGINQIFCKRPSRMPMQLDQIRPHSSPARFPAPLVESWWRQP